MRRLSDNDLPWDRTRLMDEKVQRLIGGGRLKIHVGKVTRNAAISRTEATSVCRVSRGERNELMVKSVVSIQTDIVVKRPSK